LFEINENMSGLESCESIEGGKVSLRENDNIFFYYSETFSMCVVGKYNSGLGEKDKEKC